MKNLVNKLLLVSAAIILSGHFAFCYENNMNMQDKEKEKIIENEDNASKYRATAEIIENNKNKISEFLNSQKENSIYNYFQNNDNGSSVNNSDNKENNLLDSASKNLKKRLNDIFLGNE